MSEIRYLVHTREPVFHVVLQALQDKAEFILATGSESVTDFDILVLDGRTYSPTELKPLAESALEMIDNGRPVLLIHSTEENKKILSDAGVFHSYIERDGSALLVEPRTNTSGKFIPSRGLCEQFFALPSELKGTLSILTENRDGSRIEESINYEPEVVDRSEDISAYAHFIERVELVVATLSHGAPLTSDGGSMQPPNGVPTSCYYLTDITPYYQWTCTGTKDKDTKITPVQQSFTLSGIIQAGVYYDNGSGPAKQWIKIQQDGSIFPDNGGPVKNNHKDQIGWSLGAYWPRASNSPVGQYNDDSTIVDDTSSPSTTSNSYTYVSSTSFTVGLAAGTDGLNGNMQYEISDSTSETITDWAVTQSNSLDWCMYQQVPFDGRTVNADDIGGKNGLLEPSNIALYGNTFETQSVYVFQPASGTNLGFKFPYVCNMIYQGYRSGFWGYHWRIWNFGPMPLFNLVLPCNQALG